MAVPGRRAGWIALEAGIAAADGYNVVLHEFAHLLEQGLDGLPADGAPRNPWRQVLHEEYEALCAVVDAGGASLIDPYGTQDPAEFFAVCTECFFELSAEFQARHPRLYGVLRDFYGVDPCDWPAQADAAREGSLTR